MTPAAAKKVIRAAGARGQDAVEFTAHAADESMADDGVSAYDVFHLLEYAEDVLRQTGAREKWKVYGPLVAGERYAVVVLIIEDDRVRVVTVHYPP